MVRKDKISIDSSRSTEYNLKMTKMSKNDEGNYICTAGEKTFRSYFLKAKGMCYSIHFFDLYQFITTQDLFYFEKYLCILRVFYVLKNTRLLYLLYILILKKIILTWTIIVLISWKKESASIPIDFSNITRMEGETVRLWCNATGYPKPTVTWYAYRQTGAGEKLESKPNI